MRRAGHHTGVRKASATKRARALSCDRLAGAKHAYKGLGVYKELHFRNLLIDLLHKVYDEVDQFVLEHLLGVEIRNQERNVIPLPRHTLVSLPSTATEKGREGARGRADFDGFPTEDVEALGALRQEAGELVYEDVLNLVRLLDLDGYTD